MIHGMRNIPLRFLFCAFYFHESSSYYSIMYHITNIEKYSEIYQSDIKLQLAHRARSILYFHMFGNEIYI